MKHYLFKPINEKGYVKINPRLDFKTTQRYFELNKEKNVEKLQNELILLMTDIKDVRNLSYLDRVNIVAKLGECISSELSYICRLDIGYALRHLGVKGEREVRLGKDLIDLIVYGDFEK